MRFGVVFSSTLGVCVTVSVTILADRVVLFTLFALGGVTFVTDCGDFLIVAVADLDADDLLRVAISSQK